MLAHDMNFLEHSIRKLKLTSINYNTKAKKVLDVKILNECKSFLQNPFLLPLTLDDISSGSYKYLYIFLLFKVYIYIYS